MKEACNTYKKRDGEEKVRRGGGLNNNTGDISSKTNTVPISNTEC